MMAGMSGEINAHPDEPDHASSWMVGRPKVTDHSRTRIVPGGLQVRTHGQDIEPVQDFNQGRAALQPSFL